MEKGPGGEVFCPAYHTPVNAVEGWTVNRRQFLATTSATAVAAGCSRTATPPNPAAGRITFAETRRIADQKEARDAHLKTLGAYRVPADVKRTTPKRSDDIAKLFPDLDLRTRLRVTHRLHPRFGDEPAAGETKMGGRFLWPEAEPWPVCEKFAIPLVPVLQIRMEDTPATVKFKPGTDLLQVLWSPRDHDKHGPKPQLYWRRAAGLKPAEYPSTEFALLDYVPVACRVFPEPVTELPDWATIRVTPLGDKVKAWKPDVAPGSVLADPVHFYHKHLSAAPGTKIGGFPNWKGEAKPPACETCRRGMDYLLTVDSDEWGGGMSWAPLEEHQFMDHAKPTIPGFAKSHGLTLPEPGNRHAYVCRRCPDWPVSWAS